jgi:hypothetical protein
MLTSLEIENFKGFAARQRIDFAPLTLLFGANSAGKSTILQALLYLHELLERGSADVDRTELGGSVLELGGFARLVHRHEVERAIVLRAEFATPGGLERFGRDLSDFPFPDLDDEVESAWVELTVRFRRTPSYQGPLIERAAIGLNAHPEAIVWIDVSSSLRSGEPLYACINLEHPLIAKAPLTHPELWSKVKSGKSLSEDVPGPAIDDLVNFVGRTDQWGQIAVPAAAVKRAFETDRDRSASNHSAATELVGGRWRPIFAIVRSRHAAIPRLDEPMRILPFGDIESDRQELGRLTQSTDSEENKRRAQELSASIKERERTATHVRTFLEMVVLGTTAQLLSFLRDAIYIGPLRSIPPRGFLYERAGRITSWADGLAAWDLLLADRLTLVERTNLWLRRLKAGCQIVAQQLFDRGADAEELSDGHVDKTVRRLLLDTGAGPFVLPSEVGAGVSQIIPIVVAALDGRFGLSLMEQPEIHVHPAIQVALGDLLIDAVTRDGGRRTLVVETHSEHIILRLLRRIRETTENALADGDPAFAEDKLSVLYVETAHDGVRVRRLRVDEHGEFQDRWPKGFFAERMEELL